jgi:hypothetical protein
MKLLLALRLSCARSNNCAVAAARARGSVSNRARAASGGSHIRASRRALKTLRKARRVARAAAHNGVSVRNGASKTAACRIGAWRRRGLNGGSIALGAWRIARKTLNAVAWRPRRHRQHLSGGII